MRRKTSQPSYGLAMGLAMSLAISLMLGCDGKPDGNGSASTVSPGPSAAGAASGSSATASSPAASSPAASSAAPTSSAVSKDATTICEKAAERYIGCMEKLLGEEAGALARGKRAEGIPACARDAMTVTMYRKCLPAADCASFQKCMSDFVKETDPERPPSP